MLPGTPLIVPGGKLDIPLDTDPHDFTTQVNSGVTQKLQRVELICTAAGTTPGTWSIGSNVPGAAAQAQVHCVLTQPVAVAVVGTRYVFEFPTPYIGGFTNQQHVFSVKNSVDTMGAWTLNAVGYMG